MKTDQTITGRVRLSPSLAVEMTFGASGIVCEWDPDLRPLTADEEHRYRAARNVMVSEFARLTGKRIAFGDLTADARGVTELLCFYPDGRIESLM